MKIVIFGKFGFSLKLFGVMAIMYLNRTNSPVT